MFIGRSSNPLSKAALRSGAWVLDRGDREFAQLFESLGNLRDLEELLAQKPVKPPPGPDAELLAAVNGLLGRSRAGVQLCATGASSKRVFVDVDLSPVKPPGKDFPGRFVAVNTADDWWRRVAGLHPQSPGLAVCLVVDRLGRDSILLRPKAARLRRTAARLALRPGGGSG